jgi:hypothetical protein
MSLTGDELTLNDKSYSIKDRNGNDFYLGKLITREKWFNPSHGSYSNYNDIFQFENIMPDRESYPLGLYPHLGGSDAFFLTSNYYGKKMFDEVATVGGKKKSKKRRTKKRRTNKRRTKKGRKNRRKLTRRR